MGFIRNITGATAQAEAAAKAADTQAAAIKASSENASRVAQENATQAGLSAASTAARNAAISSASDQAAVTPENPDVQVTIPEDTSAAGTARKRRASFGVGTGATGVNI